MYLLDTDTVIYSLKGHPAVKANLEHHRHAALKISIITLMELYYGAHKSQQVAGNLAKVKRIEAALEILPLGTEAAEVYAMLKSGLEKAGTPLDDFDLILAATALSHGLTLVTNNEKHLKRIDGLKLENWTQPPR